MEYFIFYIHVEPYIVGKLDDTGFGGNGGEYLAPPQKKSGLGENLVSNVFGRVFLKIHIQFLGFPLILA
jgi:hypothetical protein